MAERRAGERGAFLARPDPRFPVILVYGPDAGLVAERAARAAALSGVDAGDPFSAVTMGADEVEASVGRLFEEARTVSLFGGRRLVRVRGAGAGGGRALAGAVAELGARPLVDATIIVEAGDLKKNAPLRLAAERAPAAIALPSYPDEGRALDGLIDEELAAHRLTIGREAREALRARLGADRLASRGEVQKLCLYCYGRAAIEEADVEAIVGDVSQETLDEAVDAAATGEAKRLPHLLERLAGAGTPVYALQQGTLRHFQGLQAMRHAVEARGQPIGRVTEARRPHFRRKAALEAALRLWTLEAVNGALGRIESAILTSRKEGALADALTATLLLTLAADAARLRARSARDRDG